MTNEKLIALLYNGKISREEMLFQELGKAKNMRFLMFDILQDVNDNFFKKIKQCDLVFNNSSHPYAIEVLKSIESMGTKVIEKTELYYAVEDKWLFYLICKKNDVLTPKTILLSENLSVARKELEEFNKWPVILKRVEGSEGRFVEKAKNVKQAEEKIREFWRKSSERLPIIAQEFIDSPCYRVTTIDNQIVQAIVKENIHWKATGVYGKKFDKFTVDSKLRKIVKKIVSAVKIKICGIDFLKKDNQWLVLEVNCQPGLDFIDRDQKYLIGLVLDVIKKEIGN